MKTHRFLQLADLADRASTERVSYYCRAVKASQIGNRGACQYFQAKAQKWESIRIRACRLLTKEHQ